MTALFLLLVGVGLAWVWQNPTKAASWLTSLSKKKDKNENNVDQV